MSNYQEQKEREYQNALIKRSKKNLDILILATGSMLKVLM